MSRFRIPVTPVFCVLLLATPVPAAAKLASPPNCTLPRVLTFVGRDAAGTADPLGEFDVVVRDIANVPIWGATVTIDFSLCTDERICSDQSPGQLVDCSRHWVVDATQTDQNGAAHLRIVGSADPTAAATQGALGHVLADGVIFGWVRVAAFDHDGGGVGAADLSLWLDDFFHSPGAARSDYDGDGTVGAGDLSLWLSAFFAGGSLHGGAAASCPP